MMAEELLTDIFSMLILIILLVSSQLNGNTSDKVGRRFVVIVAASLFYLLLNSFCVFSDGRSNLSNIAYTVNLLSFTAIDFVLIAFCFYLRALLESANAKNPKLVLIPICFCIARIVVTLVLALTGNLFHFDAQGMYEEASLCFIPYCVCGLVLLELLWIMLYNRKCFTTRQFVVILIYLTGPLLPVLLEVYLDLYSLTSACITLSLLLMYVLVQVSVIEQSKLRESILEEISSTDLLTGLNNRRSYYSRLSGLEASQPVGVVYCDINRLKYTNDHFGHAAGDELIRNFANLLSGSFRSNDIYRISGDEFVVMATDISQSVFDRRTEAFRELIGKNERIASMGCSYGSGSCIDKLISESEQAMYEDKRQYHEALNGQ